MPTESLDAPLHDPKRHKYEGPSFEEIQKDFLSDRCTLCNRKHDEHPPDSWFKERD